MKVIRKTYLSENFVELMGLILGAWESVENKTLFTVWLGKITLDQSEYDIVRNETTVCNNVLYAIAQITEGYFQFVV